MDYNKIAALEHEIEKKYGRDATKHPRSDWDQTKEQEYIKQTTELNSKISNLITEKTYENKKGYLVSKKLFNDDSDNSTCPYCKKYKFNFTVMDDLNLNKYGCCRDCFYNYVEGREERWLGGWRPNK